MNTMLYANYISIRKRTKVYKYMLEKTTRRRLANI